MKMYMKTQKRALSRLALWTLAIAMLAPKPAATAEPVLIDANIRNAIEEQLAFDNAVPENKIDLSVNEGIVSLSGEVSNALAKERAAQVAETVKGVRSVVNQIDVKPFWNRMDWQIQSDIEEAFIYDSATDSWEIDAEVDDHIATLTGTVSSWEEKRLAERVAKGVKGVKGINNQITVEYEDERSDLEISEDIERRFEWDTRVDAGLIDVNVEDGEVTLTGTVGSASEKAWTTTNAWVAGVKEVDASELNAEKWARDEDLRPETTVDKEDSEIEKAVKDALLYDPRVMSADVEVECDTGYVTLRGKVDNLKAKRAAAQDARNTVSVYKVKNLLKTQADEGIDDSEIKEAVEAAFERDPYIEQHEIGVAVVNNVVHLTGSVDSYYEKGRAEDIASKANGVEETRNKITVDYDRAPLAYNPYTYTYYPYGYSWYDYEPMRTYQTDEEIKSNIESQLFWSPFVDSDEVNVTVEDGRAILTGTVGSYSERQSAEENAYEGGAVWVTNRVDVSNG